LLAAMVKLGLAGLGPERALGVVARVLYLALVNRAITGSWRRVAWLPLAMTFGLLLFVDVNMRAYPWVVGMPLFLAGLLALPTRPALAVPLFTAAGLTRLEFAECGIVALGILLLLERRKHYTVRRMALTLLALVGALGGAYLFFVVQSGGQAFVDLVLDPSRGITSWPGRPHLWPLAFGPIGVPILAASILSPLLMTILGLARRRPYVAATNASMLLLVPHYLQWPDASHLFSLAAVTIPWALVCLAWAKRRQSPHQRAPGPVQRAALIATLAGGIWAALVAASYTVYFFPFSPFTSQGVGTLSQRLISAGDRSLIELSPQDAQSGRALIRFAERNIPPRDEIVILPKSDGSLFTRTDMYYVLQRRPATRYLMLLGLVAHQGAARELLRDLHGCRWVVILHGGPWFSPATPPLFGGRIERYLAAHTRVVFRSHTYDVLRRV
jgi:hypothetical protein